MGNNQNDLEKGPSKKNGAAFLKWFKPVIQALRDLGGSATRADTVKKIIENENLNETEINEVRGKYQVNKLDNDVAFARQLK